MSSASQSDQNGHAARDKLSNKAYEKDLRRLHVELVNLQEWVVREGANGRRQ
jgi:polyphosphate kinase 2 (PPK2 family)